eukprot:TRINITY_DN861_c0_g1_i1.p1 TRINITY_DN861_c0_g1~~TRINITY_DN861_c0_g1_i1.p1  ORF type:complete len:638 (-),score=146.72 TRINITY_DN861_c0_g1_i1:56-1969(-)
MKFIFIPLLLVVVYAKDYYYTPSTVSGLVSLAYSGTAFNGGDTITLAAGDYLINAAGPGGYGIGLWFKYRHSGSNASYPVTIRGDPNGARPRIIVRNVDIGVLIHDNPGNKWTLEYLHVQGSNDGNAAAAGHVSFCVFNKAYGTTVNNVIMDSCGNGLSTHDSESGDITVSNSEVKFCGAGTYEHGIYASRGLTDTATFTLYNTYIHDVLGGNGVKSRFPKTKILYNTIDYNAGTGRTLELISADCVPDGTTCLTVPTTYEADVVGNVLTNLNSVPYGFHRIGRDTTGNPSGGKPPSYGKYRFVGNTYVGSSTLKEGITLWGAITSLDFYNNIIHMPAGTGKFMSLTAGTIDSGTYYGSLPTISGSNNYLTTGVDTTVSTGLALPASFGVRSTSVGFTSSSDYSLTSSSAAVSGALASIPTVVSIYTAKPAYEPPKSFTGGLVVSPTVRPSTNSLGAFEYRGGATPVAPVAQPVAPVTQPVAPVPIPSSSPVSVPVAPVPVPTFGSTLTCSLRATTSTTTIQFTSTFGTTATADACGSKVTCTKRRSVWYCPIPTATCKPAYALVDGICCGLYGACPVAAQEQTADVFAVDQQQASTTGASIEVVIGASVGTVLVVILIAVLVVAFVVHRTNRIEKY